MASRMSTKTIEPATNAARRGTYIAFLGSGFASASWAARIPQVRAHLHLTPATLGLLLLAIAAGSVATLPFSGLLVQRFTSRWTVIAMVFLASLCTDDHRHWLPRRRGAHRDRSLPVRRVEWSVGPGPERPGGNGRAAAGPVDHVSLPCRLERRDGRRGRGRGRHGGPSRLGNSAPGGCRHPNCHRRPPPGAPLPS